MEKLGTEYIEHSSSIGYRHYEDVSFIVKLSVDEYNTLKSLETNGGDLVVGLRVAAKLLEAHRQLHPEPPKPPKKKK